MKKTFVPTENMKAAALTVFMAMTQLEFIEPIVNGYKKMILAQREWLVREEFRERHDEFRITEPDSDFLMTEADFADFFALCDAERKSAGLVVHKEGGCPLSDAKHDLSLAKLNLIKAMMDDPNVGAERFLSASLKIQNEFVELSLKLLAPFVQVSKAA